jgi:spore germination protein KC
MIKKILLLLLCGLPLLITGCSNYSEINNVMIVDGIGINKINDEYLVSFNTYVGNDKYETYDVLVKDLDTSFNEIYLLVNKKIYLSHLNILLISSSLDNNDNLKIMNTFNNRDDLRGSFLVSIVDNYDDKIFSDKNIVTLLNNNYKESGK